MRDPRLQKKLADFEYERRVDRLMLPSLLALLPPALLGVVTWLQYGVVSWAGVSIAAATCTLIIVYGGVAASRSAVDTMKREGIAGEGYQPPLL